MGKVDLYKQRKVRKPSHGVASFLFSVFDPINLILTFDSISGLFRFSLFNIAPTKDGLFPQVLFSSLSFHFHLPLLYSTLVRNNGSGLIWFPRLQWRCRGDKSCQLS